MTAKVIQGSFLAGQPKRPPSVQPKITPPPFRVGRAPSFTGQAQPIQRHGAGGAFTVEAGPLGLVSSGGRPLPEGLRGKMEAALGADFSGVRVHVGQQAERIGAIAFTIGSDIYFAPGRYQPETIQGQQLLGHELAHVVQQRQGRVRNPPGNGIAVVQDRALEAEADRLGQRAASHRIAAQPKIGPGVPRRGPVGQHFVGTAHTASRPSPGASRWPGAVRIQRYEVVNWTGKTDEFLAQEEPGATKDNPGAFLKNSNKARVQAPTGGIQLRVSDDGKMAIEHSNLSQRQAKCFFATPDVIKNSNSTLRGTVRLATTGQTIEVPYQDGSVTLLQVVPRAESDADDLSTINDPQERRRRIAAIQFSQNCNNIAEQISGLSDLAFSNSAVDTVLDITGADRSAYNSALVSANSQNNQQVEKLVEVDPGVAQAVAKADRIYDKLQKLKVSLLAAKNSASWTDMNLGGFLEAAGWGNEYTKTVNNLSAEISRLQIKLSDRLDAATDAKNVARDRINADERIKKICQSPIWDLAQRYVDLINSSEGPATLKGAGVNQFADAQQPGDVYQISHIATSKKRLAQESALWDFASQSKKRTSWGWHFATVVAVSGADRVTLENFARGDNRQKNPDPRWYFQMYGSRPGQSFHEQAASEYANPITVVHRGPGNQ